MATKKTPTNPRRAHPVTTRKRRKQGPLQSVTIAKGEFAGRRVEDLTDDELPRFMTGYARNQWKVGIMPFLTLSGTTPQPMCLDLAPYWCARYELVRRKPNGAEPAKVLEVRPDDTDLTLANRLIEYAFRVAAMKQHPDHGGTNAGMQRLIRARDFAKSRIRTSKGT
jgi:hypothetical protein